MFSGAEAGGVSLRETNPLEKCEIVACFASPFQLTQRGWSRPAQRPPRASIASN